MAARIIQERVGFLLRRIFNSSDIPLSDENELSDELLGELNIRRIPFNPEDMHIESINRSQDPPILFQAMAPEKLDRYPLCSWYAEPGMMDYPEITDTHNPETVAREIASHIDRYACGASRENIPQGAVSLLGVQGLDTVTMPNELFLHTTFCGGYPHTNGGFRANWSGVFTAEPLRVDGRRVYPHMTLGVIQESNGDKNTILYGELAPIVDAMHARTQQTVVSEEEEEEEEEALFEREAPPPSGPLAFAREERFPVLLLSFLGPHHGRVFYACMDDTELVIRQSRLYDFRSQSTAPVDLFTRLYLSQPLSA